MPGEKKLVEVEGEALVGYSFTLKFGIMVGGTWVIFNERERRPTQKIFAYKYHDVSFPTGVTKFNKLNGFLLLCWGVLQF